MLSQKILYYAYEILYYAYETLPNPQVVLFNKLIVNKSFADYSNRLMSLEPYEFHLLTYEEKSIDEILLKLNLLRWPIGVDGLRPYERAINKNKAGWLKPAIWGINFFLKMVRLYYQSDWGIKSKMSDDDFYAVVELASVYIELSQIEAIARHARSRS